MHGAAGVQGDDEAVRVRSDPGHSVSPHPERGGPRPGLRLEPMSGSACFLAVLIYYKIGDIR